MSDRRKDTTQTDAAFWAGLSGQFKSLDPANQIAAEIYFTPSRPDYRLRNTPSDNVQNELKRLMRQAGIASGAKKDIAPDLFWLQKLHRYLRENRSSYLVRTVSTAHVVPSKNKNRSVLPAASRLAFDNRAELKPASTQRSGIVVIQPVCEASAMLCSWIEGQALETSASSSATVPSPTLIDQGKFCEQVIGEMKKIKNLCGGGNSSVAKIQQEHPEFAVWKVRESLDEDLREAFNHPRQWGPVVGYAHIILGKSFDRKPPTIKDWVKAYRSSKKRCGRQAN